jgi:hypothetical protein
MIVGWSKKESVGAHGDMEPKTSGQRQLRLLPIILSLNHYAGENAGPALRECRHSSNMVPEMGIRFERSPSFLFNHLKFTFLSPRTGIKIATKLYPVHSFSSGIQAKDMFVGLSDVLYSTDVAMADSPRSVF